jgi:hypothetical protein
VLTLGGKGELGQATTQRIKVTLQPVNPDTGEDAQVTDVGRGPDWPVRLCSPADAHCPGTAAGRDGDGGGMGVDRYRVCGLYAAGPDIERSGSGYPLGDHLADRPPRDRSGAGRDGSRLLVRPPGVPGWLPARVESQDVGGDAALVAVEDEGWLAPGRQYSGAVRGGRVPVGEGAAGPRGTPRTCTGS